MDTVIERAARRSIEVDGMIVDIGPSRLGNISCVGEAYDHV